MRRRADGTYGAVGAWICCNPAYFTTAVALGDRNSKTLFEATPILAQQRRRTRNQKPESLKCFAVGRIVGVEQHVYRGGIAGGDCCPLLHDVLEKSTAGKLSS